MLKWLFKIMFKFRGWKLHRPTPPEAFNCIMVAAPHTSNWDFVYAISGLDQLGVNPRFTIKNEMNRFPIGGMVTKLGALWIDRTPNSMGTKLSMVQLMACLFKAAKTPMSLIVTAEGTRSKTKKWKTGFYYAAMEAKVPICLAFMDYKTRIAGVGMCFRPCGDINIDMKIIMDFYRDKQAQGKYPENFALDERYS